MTTSRPRRTLVALAATVTLALAGCGGDDPETESTSATSPSASDSPTAEESKPSKPSKKTSPPEPVDEVVVDVSIVGDDVTPVAQSVELGVGETLLLEVTSDRAGELHVHSSPEQFADFQAGASQLDFTFDKPGSVDIEEHDSGALIVRVLVQ
jgi:hypothetical protein